MGVLRGLVGCGELANGELAVCADHLSPIIEALYFPDAVNDFRSSTSLQDAIKVRYDSPMKNIADRNIDVSQSPSTRAHMRPMLWLLVSIVALGSHRTHAQSAESNEAARAAVSQSALSGRIADALIYAVSMIGVPYRYGGTDAATGFDCSGFVYHVFGNIIAHSMPRHAEGMSRSGTRVDRTALKPGDLVFYNTLGRAFSHVGIYLGNNQFIHAPSAGKSVEIVDMEDRYWKSRFNGARRFFSEFAPISIPQGVPTALAE
jgi:cell wall-associated NlpC family hydrolase